jgi:membrane protease YdiL (CAAX protease family)
MSLPPRPDLLPEEGRDAPPPATWKAIEALPVALIWLAATAVFSSILVFIFPSRLSSGNLLDDPLLFTVANAFQELSIIGSVALWIRLVNHGSLRSLGLPPREPGRDVGAGVLAAVGMIFASGIVLVAVRALVDLVAGHSVSGPEQIPRTVTGGYLWFTGVVVVVLAPVAEETFFRGFLYRGLRRVFSAWPAALISGVCFGLVHFQEKRSLLIIPSLIVVGIVLAMVYERRRSLLASVAAHAVFNLLGFLTIALGR